MIPLNIGGSILVIGIFLLVMLIIFGLTYYNSRKQRVLRALKKFEPKRITQFRTNELSKTTGKVLHVHEPLRAPYSNRKCVAYHIKIEHYRSNGKVLIGKP